MAENTQVELNKDLIVLPDPERIVTGLRDTGYNFNTAVADIVDNSIAADATIVSIQTVLTPDMQVRIYFADNGIGMDNNGLINAMRYGSKAREDKGSLGKFGLGLKTASTAFCKRLIVLSRPKNSSSVEKVQWDLDYIAETNAWTLQCPEIEADELDLLEEVTDGKSGTLVVWEKVDRLLKHDYKTYKGAQKGMESILNDLRFHLSLVFQRFLDQNDSRARNVRIFLNTIELTPWDPFCLTEEKTKNLQTVKQPVTLPDGSSPSFRVAAYVIPRKDEFSSPAAAKNARGNNDFQGFYIYRENRLIHYGDWLGFFTKEPHLSLLRVDFSFTHELDDLLNVDIKKSRILLIGELSEFLINFLNAPRREAQKIYRTGETENLHVPGKNAHAPSNQNIDSKGASVEGSKITPTGVNVAKVENPNGTFTKTITISSSTDPKQTRVVPVQSLDDGVLWEPGLVDNKHAVRINESHPYYKKVYGPILSQSVIVEGLDALLWALAEAENTTCNQQTIENYEDMRVTVSRILKKLVADFPDPEIPTE